MTPPISFRLSSPSRLSLFLPPKPVPSLVGFGGLGSSRICEASSILYAALFGVIAIYPLHTPATTTTLCCILIHLVCTKLREENTVQYWPLWSPIRLTTRCVVREAPLMSSPGDSEHGSLDRAAGIWWRVLGHYCRSMSYSIKRRAHLMTLVGRALDLVLPPMLDRLLLESY